MMPKLNWLKEKRKKAKKELQSKGLMKEGLIKAPLTKKGQEELAYANLFLYEKGDKVLDSALGEEKKPEWFSKRDYFIQHEGRLPHDAIWALQKTQKNPRLGSSPIDTLQYWHEHTSAKQRKEFKRKHKNPETELKVKKAKR